MNITVNKQDGLRHEFSIVVAANEIEKSVEQELQSYGKKAKIPGFRPGKVPMNILKQRYGKDVMGDVIRRSVDKATHDALTKHSLRPAIQPDIKIKSFEEGGDLAFDMAVESLPEIPEIDFSKFTVSEFQFDVPAEEVEEGLKRLAERSRHPHETKEGTKAKEGDVVKIDFVGKIDGVAFDGGSAKGHQLELGSNQFIPGFEEQLIGVKAGDEKTVKVTFPKDYHSDAYAGKDAEFDVTVHAVLNIHTPDVDEEFAKKVGFESLDKLREAVTEQIKADYNAAARARAKKELFDVLDEKVKFDAPPSMVKMEFESVWKQVGDAKKKGDASLDKPEAELRKEFEAVAERRVRLGILLSELARKQNLQVTNDELTRAVLDQARMFPGQEQKVFELYKQNPQHVEELKGPIIEEKGVDLILSKVKRTEKKVAVSELFDSEEGDAKAEKAKKPVAAKKKTSAKKAEEK